MKTRQVISLMLVVQMMAAGSLSTMSFAEEAEDNGELYAADLEANDIAWVEPVSEETYVEKYYVEETPAYEEPETQAEPETPIEEVYVPEAYVEAAEESCQETDAKIENVETVAESAEEIYQESDANISEASAEALSETFFYEEPTVAPPLWIWQSLNGKPEQAPISDWPLTTDLWYWTYQNWTWMFQREPVVEWYQNQSAVTVEGVVPENSIIKAEVIDLNESDTWREYGLFAYDVRLNGSDGQMAVPSGDLHIVLSCPQFQELLWAGREIKVYLDPMDGYGPRQLTDAWIHDDKVEILTSVYPARIILTARVSDAEWTAMEAAKAEAAALAEAQAEAEALAEEVAETPVQDQVLEVIELTEEDLADAVYETEAETKVDTETETTEEEAETEIEMKTSEEAVVLEETTVPEEAEVPEEVAIPEEPVLSEEEPASEELPEIEWIDLTGETAVEETVEESVTEETGTDGVTVEEEPATASIAEIPDTYEPVFEIAQEPITETEPVQEPLVTEPETLDNRAALVEAVLAEAQARDEQIVAAETETEIETETEAETTAEEDTQPILAEETAIEETILTEAPNGEESEVVTSEEEPTEEAATEEAITDEETTEEAVTDEEITEEQIIETEETTAEEEPTIEAEETTPEAEDQSDEEETEGTTETEGMGESEEPVVEDPAQEVQDPVAPADPVAEQETVFIPEDLFNEEDSAGEDAEDASKESAQRMEKAASLEEENCQVVIRYDAEAGIPEDAVLSVTAIREGEEYEARLQEAIDALDVDGKENAIKEFFLLDISLVSGGVDYAGDGKFEVQVIRDSAGKDEPGGQSAQALRFGTESPELLETEADLREDGTVITFRG